MILQWLCSLLLDNKLRDSLTKPSLPSHELSLPSRELSLPSQKLSLSSYKLLFPRQGQYSNSKLLVENKKPPS